MKRAFYLLLSATTILILLGYLSKPMHWHRQKEFVTAAICTAAAAIGIFFYSQVVKKRKITD